MEQDKTDPIGPRCIVWTEWDQNGPNRTNVNQIG